METDCDEEQGADTVVTNLPSNQRRLGRVCCHSKSPILLKPGREREYSRWGRIFFASLSLWLSYFVFLFHKYPIFVPMDVRYFLFFHLKVCQTFGGEVPMRGNCWQNHLNTAVYPLCLCFFFQHSHPVPKKDTNCKEPFLSAASQSINC